MPQLYTTRMNVILLIIELFEYCCDLGRVIPIWFQVIIDIVMHILPFKSDHTSIFLDKHVLVVLVHILFLD